MLFRSVVDKFFARIANALRRFFGIAKNQGYLPNTTFKEYMDRMVDLAAFDAQNKVTIDTSEDVVQKSVGDISLDTPNTFSFPNAPFQTARGMDKFIQKIPMFGDKQAGALSSAIDNSEKAVRAGILGFLPTHALSDLAEIGRAHV